MLLGDGAFATSSGRTERSAVQAAADKVTSQLAEIATSQEAQLVHTQLTEILSDPSFSDLLLAHRRTASLAQPSQRTAKDPADITKAAATALRSSTHEMSLADVSGLEGGLRRLTDLAASPSYRSLALQLANVVEGESFTKLVAMLPAFQASMDELGETTVDLGLLSWLSDSSETLLYIAGAVIIAAGLVTGCAFTGPGAVVCAGPVIIASAGIIVAATVQLGNRVKEADDAALDEIASLEGEINSIYVGIYCGVWYLAHPGYPCQPPGLAP